jgi:L-aminopeptidase/D-esterase-like protein
VTGSLTDVPGLAVGHAGCPRSRTGVTVIVPDAPAVMAVDVRGGGPGTRETDALDPANLVERAHAIVLSGGSVFGLAAADAVALGLARRGRGLEVAPGLFVPVVPAAILFDLRNGGDKGWAARADAEPPYRRLAQEALLSLSRAPAAGPVGAGLGARAGSRPGGVGMASARLDEGGVVAVLAVVNSFGEVEEGEPPAEGAVPMPKLAAGPPESLGASTTLAVVATDRPLTRAAARRLAMMGHDGLARAIRPVHAPYDGDVVFALSTAAETPAAVAPRLLTELGTRAADCLVSAVRSAVAPATGLPG